MRVERRLRRHVLLGKGIALHHEAGDGRVQRQVLAGSCPVRPISSICCSLMSQSSRRFFAAATRFSVLSPSSRACGLSCICAAPSAPAGTPAAWPAPRDCRASAADRPSSLLAGEIDEDLVDPAFELRSAPWRSSSRRASRAPRRGSSRVDGLVLRRAELHADQLLLLRT